MVELRHVQKVIDQRTVVDIDELTVAPGEVTAVVGVAGSGTETLLQLLTGRTRPTAGTVRVGGTDPARDHTTFTRQTGVLFGEDSLYRTRSPRANLAFHARLRGLPRARVDEVLVRVGLGDHAGATIDKLSSGLKRRLAYGIAILHQPAVLLLVDPFARCDDASISLLGEGIREHARQDGTVLILSDSDADLFDICDAIYTLDQGRIAGRRRPREEPADVRLPFKIPVKAEGRVALVNPGDILYVVSEEGLVSLQTRAERLPTQFTLAELEARLVRRGFFRAHRAYLVNLQHVTEVIPFTRSSFSLRLNDPAGTLIPLSKQAAKELRDLLNY